MKKLGNTSSAVMQQRNKPRNDGLDDFPTPPWATRALIEHVLKPPTSGLDYFKTLNAWEPACNRGYMARVLREYFHDVVASDIKRYGFPCQEHDFLMPMDGLIAPDWIITNPPFRLADQFAARCEQLAPREGYALLVRTSFLEGVGRFKELFSRNPPNIVAQFSERVPMVEGRFDPTASTATSYCWLVWEPGDVGTEFVWIPPCRKRLERPTDNTWEVADA